MGFRYRRWQGSLDLAYDHAAGRAHYRRTGQTFLLGHRWTANGVVELGDDRPVDDLATTLLNYADRQLEVRAPGEYGTLVLARAAGTPYRLAPLPVRFSVARDPATRRDVSFLDLTPFSSWARAGQPARIVFDAGRRPATFEAALRWGTRVRIYVDWAARRASAADGAWMPRVSVASASAAPSHA
jgi:hypothetical protein